MLLTRWLPSFLLALICSLPVWGYEWQEKTELASIFSQAGVTGAFVLYDTDRDIFLGHDHYRAQTRFVPASTFKIANTLIGLKVGAVKSLDEIFPYDGKGRRLQAWEADMDLRQAIKVSNLPVYQELARRIGLERMQAELIILDYGNSLVGPEVDRFWLDGPLAISALEQTRFLARLARQELAYPAHIQASVRQIILQEKNASYALFAKTGLALAAPARPGIGWWVGWVEKEGRVYSFALNLDPSAPGSTEKRQPVGRLCLAALGLIP